MTKESLHANGKGYNDKDGKQPCEPGWGASPAACLYSNGAPE